MSTEPTTELAEVTRANQIAEQSYELALEVKIDSPEMYDICGQELRGIVTRQKQIEELRLSLTRPLDESKRRIMDLFRAPIDRLGQAQSLLRDEMGSYKRQQDELAAEARRKAEAEAAAERARQEATQREAEERMAKAAREQAAALKAGDAEKVAAAEAAAAEAAEAAEAAREQVELAEIAPPTAPAVAQASTAGISSRRSWKAEVTDLKALVIEAARRAAAGDDFLLGFISPNTTAINGAARSMQARLVVPGIRVYAEESLAVRRR